MTSSLTEIDGKMRNSVAIGVVVGEAEAELVELVDSEASSFGLTVTAIDEEVAAPLDCVASLSDLQVATSSRSDREFWILLFTAGAA